MAQKLTAIDLFSGAGGFSLAAHNVGVNVLAAIEFDQSAAETYQKNLVERLGAPTQVFAQDITKFDIDSLIRDQGIKKGHLDILLGGPPCQGFSSHRFKDSGKDDPRNALLIRYFDFVEHLKPKAFLVENVPGLLWPRHEKYLNDFLQLAKDHGYRVITGAPLILNAKDYGVPQNRRRAFIFALRNDVIRDDIEWPPKATHYKSGDCQWLTASSIFEEPKPSTLNEFKRRLEEKFGYTEDESAKRMASLKWGKELKPEDPCNLNMVHSEALTQVFENTPLLGSRDESGRVLNCHKGDYKGHKDVYGRIFPHQPSNTITTGCNNPSKGRFVHPWLPHGITLRHAARLQTFPDDYMFTGGSMAMAKQIGNAVPIKLGEALISEISKLLSAS
ncbi:DNA (cytosine-5-)-methyltransferase [Marinomonas sp. RSW2]|uniref:Cytosine-specific methyltransferase n=1 Tax=Marinomonas maritima TaxID=2940935 RepID=A0ABT5WIC3_9GAMM|nr:DNA (cytosine-5-)-methyltransferase [Marinomonas maritima]MDE8604549.1 DNA (cytosine-5-)-methyltransferase [Marinomonas maritima]